MSKRANGEGSIYQRKDGRWTGATYVIRPDGGRERRQVYGTTRGAVAAKIADLITKTANGVPASSSDWTVEGYAAHWLANIAPGALRPATRSNYAWIMRKYVVPAVGKRKLDKLTPAHVREMHTKVSATGVSDRTVQLSHAVLRTMLSEAVREQYVSRNVASLVRAPRGERAEIVPWSLADVEAFVKAAKDHRLSALFTLAYSTGLRRGELLGLRWQDLDFDRRLLHVRQTLQRLGKDEGLVLGPPKSMRSRRSIPLPAVAVEALTVHRQEQLVERSAAREGWVESDFVFTTTIGTSIEPSNLLRTFNALTVKAGVRRIRFHDLRHTFASLMFSQNVPPRVVMDVLGHSTLAITTDLYAHIMPSALVDAATAMDSLHVSSLREEVSS
ncbi:Site-specific recombinase XerD [Agreia bicolorata]|uniref:Site-specific recombinase XerD n=1 Tax=Agreia bicolorata TaxID=110935 RepID=A0A1T4WTY5_9MICO|nr:site-specific integrase [Agreia bicolorata]SKA80739.1 Site-specific recombinase XerD [Agreia bicolorata]